MDILLILIFSLIIVTLGIVVIALGFYYTNLVEKFNQAQKQNLYLKYHFQEKSLQKVNSAKDTSLKIITDATAQAEEILKRAESLKAGTNEETKLELAELVRQQEQILMKASD